MTRSESGLTRLDPFTDSEEAVDAWEEGDFESLVRHNVAEIRRPRSLMQLAERYYSKYDFSMKSLDPMVGAEYSFGARVLYRRHR